MKTPHFEFHGTPLERARNGAVLGAIIATAFLLYVAGLYLLRGDGPFERLGTTVWGTIGMYYMLGLVAGPILGIVWPLRNSRAGSGLVVGLGGLIVYIVGLMTQQGSPLNWSLTDWGGPLTLGVLGFLLGFAFYRPPPQPAPPPEPTRLRTTWPEESESDGLE